jgi:hypothetical protein
MPEPKYYLWVTFDPVRTPRSAQSLKTAIEDFDKKYFKVHTQALASALMLADMSDIAWELQQLMYEIDQFTLCFSKLHTIGLSYPSLWRFRLCLMQYIDECNTMRSILWHRWFIDHGLFITDPQSPREIRFSTEISKLIWSFLKLRHGFSWALWEESQIVNRRTMESHLDVMMSRCEELHSELEEYGAASVWVDMVYNLCRWYRQMIAQDTIDCVKSGINPTYWQDQSSDDQWWSLADIYCFTMLDESIPEFSRASQSKINPQYSLIPNKNNKNPSHTLSFLYFPEWGL